MRWRSRLRFGSEVIWIVQRQVLGLRRLLRGAVHRGHRQRQHRDEVEPVLRDHGHRRAEREQRGRRPAAEDQVAEQVGADRRPAGAGPPRCGPAWSSRRRRRPRTIAIAGRSLAASPPGSPRPVPPSGLEHEAGGDPRERELREVEDDAVERAAPDQVREQRRAPPARPRPPARRRRAASRRRTAWRRSPPRPGRAPGSGTARRAGRVTARTQNSASSGPMSAPADEGEPDDRRSTGGGYEPQVKREGGKLARHWSESRRGGPLQAWAKRTPLYRAAQCGKEPLELTGRTKRLEQDEEPSQGGGGAVRLRLEGKGSYDGASRA